MVETRFLNKNTKYRIRGVLDFQATFLTIETLISSKALLSDSIPFWRFPFSTCIIAYSLQYVIID